MEINRPPRVRQPRTKDSWTWPLLKDASFMSIGMDTSVWRMKMERWSSKKSTHIHVKYASRSSQSLVKTRKDLSAARWTVTGIHVKSVVVVNTVEGFGGWWTRLIQTTNIRANILATVILAINISIIKMRQIQKRRDTFTAIIVEFLNVEIALLHHHEQSSVVEIAKFNLKG